MKRKVYLEGELGQKFGKEFTMNVDSFSEVFRCLECNYPEIRKYLIDCEEKNIGFVCEVANTPLTSEAELLLEYGEGDMLITPIPAGSKSAGGKILAAIALVAVVYFTGGFGAEGYIATGLKAGGSLKAYAGLAALSMATNLAMTGIQQMMAPDPSVDNDQDESYLFQGTGQTLIEGDPVPVLYGKLRVPGRPISLHVRNESLNFYDHGGVLMDSPADTTTPNVVPGPGNNPESPPTPIRIFPNFGGF
jgi:predicted phage tail protein